MALSTQPYKGARDFYPEDKRLQKWMFATMRRVCESFGYEEYDAPLLEPTELFASKTSDEIVNEQTYTFKDRGDRSVTIRTEMTPSVSRMVAGRRQELAYPVRWYSIPNVWRYERPQRGRLREFWQLNVDLFGVEGIKADIEIIEVAHKLMNSFGATEDMYEIRLGSRKLVNHVLEAQGLDEVDKKLYFRISDNWSKYDDDSRPDYIIQCLEKSGYGEEKQKRFIEKLSERNEAIQAAFNSPAAEGIREVLDHFEKRKIKIHFDAFLTRGFDYYTDIVFEVFDTNPDNNRSMFGGGRYDGLVGLFGVEPVPTVGFGMGDVTLQNFLEAHGLLPKLQPEVDIYAILIGDVYERAQTVVTQLREAGLNVAVDSTGRKPDKQIKAAVKKGIAYALFIGEKELADGQFMLKDLTTQVENRHSAEDIVNIVKGPRD